MHYPHQGNVNALDYFVVMQYPHAQDNIFTSFDLKMQYLGYFGLMQ
jgi:hypothetical protein